MKCLSLICFETFTPEGALRPICEITATSCNTSLRHTSETVYIQNLPKEIEGFIYISFGSVVQILALPADFIEIFMQAIRSLRRFHFLWKWEGKKPDNIPGTALLLSWLPQQDVLGANDP
ncbi:unnamed protein product [Allacma fusca]|uniref:Uncharacterized protein n=1 Tax=Allacma fusca TaxID=39272 RepID=A0A8J2KQ36_9HEXA|nr:unnamed protein product [Allacma fusca]